MPGDVVLSGGTGLVGGRVAQLLAGSGTGVRALTRRPERARFEPPIRAVGWDGERVPEEALAGARAIVHLSGEPVFAGPLTRERRRRIRASRIDSTRAIVEAVAALPGNERPDTLICASAVGYYGNRGDETLDEQSPPGDGFLARVCIEWEAAALEAERHGLRAVCLRIGVVLAREGGALQLMCLPFKLGLGGRLGSGRQWFPWIHLEDVAAMACAAVDLPHWTGPVNAVAPEAVTNAELTATLGRVLRRPTLLPLPGAALKLALGELAIELLGSRRVVPSRALTHGFAFAQPTLEGALAACLS